MDKEKIKASVNEVAEVTNELVAAGRLDGDQAKQILFDFTEQTIRKEFEGNAEVG